MTELGHRPCLDLTNALTRQVEVLADVLERPRLTPVQPEAEAQNLALTLVKGGKQAVDLEWQQRGGGHLEGRLRRAVLDHVTKLGIPVLTKRLRQRQGLGTESQRLDQLVLGKLDLSPELGERSWPA